MSLTCIWPLEVLEREVVEVDAGGAGDLSERFGDGSCMLLKACRERLGGRAAAKLAFKAGVDDVAPGVRSWFGVNSGCLGPVVVGPLQLAAGDGDEESVSNGLRSDTPGLGVISSIPVSVVVAVVGHSLIIKLDSELEMLVDMAGK